MNVYIVVASHLAPYRQKRPCQFNSCYFQPNVSPKETRYATFSEGNALPVPMYGFKICSLPVSFFFSTLPAGGNFDLEILFSAEFVTFR